MYMYIYIYMYVYVYIYVYIYVYVNMYIYIYICEPGPRISTPPQWYGLLSPHSTFQTFHLHAICSIAAFGRQPPLF